MGTSAGKTTQAVSTEQDGGREVQGPSLRKNYKWWALSCTSLGMLLATTNSGTLIIALPDLERNLHTSLLELVWVILAYMIASTVLVLTAGRLSDLFGRKKAYLLGFVLFAAGSLGAGFATGGTDLILWRILQGVGGAFVFANSAALVTDAFPRRQLGLAMGTNTMVAAIGLVIGPVLGGELVTIGWQWVFWFNVPLALLGSLWGALVLRELARPDQVRGLDLWGTAVFLVGLTGLVLGVSRGGINGWSDHVAIGGFVAAVVFLPLFLLIERRGRAPMLDLSIFSNKLFSAASAAAFVNGLSRFALLFVFVFYFQGVQGDDPITAGIKLAPMALGMLVSSPIAGIYADRRGSRALAALGMLVTAGGLAAMTTLEPHSPYWQSTLWLAIVGIGSGMFNSPNTAAMMGTVAAHRRGVAAGARTLLQNTGAVISIAFVIAIVTAAVPKDVLFRIVSGLSQGMSQDTLQPFVTNLHTALWVLAATSLVGAVISLLRPSHSGEDAEHEAPADRTDSKALTTLSAAESDGASDMPQPELLASRASEVERLSREVKSKADELSRLASQVGSLGLQTSDAELAGSLRIASFRGAPAPLVSASVARLKQRHPGVEVTLCEGSEAQVGSWLANRQIDVGVVVSPVSQAEVICQAHDQLCAVVPKGHRLAGAASVSISDLTAEPLILATDGLEKAVRHAGAAHNLPAASHQPQDLQSVLRLVADGIGVSILPALTVPHTDAAVRALPLAPPLFCPFALAVPGGQISDLARALLAEVQDFARERDLAISCDEKASDGQLAGPASQR